MRTEDSDGNANSWTKPQLQRLRGRTCALPYSISSGPEALWNIPPDQNYWIHYVTITTIDRTQ